MEPKYITKSYAEIYLKQEHKYIKEDQLIIRDYNDDTKLNMLNHVGQKLMRIIQSDLKYYNFDGVITCACLKSKKAKSHYKDRNHVDYKITINSSQESLEGMTCSRDILFVEGKQNGYEMITSAVVMLDWTKGWVYTISGNLYKLIPVDE